jgi:hypothetical protein
VSTPVLPSLDVAAIAKAYADFGGILVGFGFAVLFHYLTKADPDGQRRKKKNPEDPHPVRKAHVTMTVLYAMASLAMTSFLYASLAGEAPSSPGGQLESPPWAVAALLPYGVAFALSVLMLFYGLTLIMLEKKLTGVAAWSYWMVACAGPAIVLRFLLTAAGAARQAACQGTCGSIWPLTRGQMFLAVAGMAVGTAAIMLIGMDWRGFRAVRDHPAAPAIVLFALVAAMTGLGSLYLTGRGPHYQASLTLVT